MENNKYKKKIIRNFKYWEKYRGTSSVWNLKFLKKHFYRSININSRNSSISSHFPRERFLLFKHRNVSIDIRHTKMHFITRYRNKPDYKLSISIFPIPIIYSIAHSIPLLIDLIPLAGHDLFRFMASGNRNGDLFIYSREQSTVISFEMERGIQHRTSVPCV